MGMVEVDGKPSLHTVLIGSLLSTLTNCLDRGLSETGYYQTLRRRIRRCAITYARQRELQGLAHSLLMVEKHIDVILY